MTAIFSTFKKIINESRDPQNHIRGQSDDEKVIAPKHAYSGNIFNRNGILGQFLAK